MDLTLRRLAAAAAVGGVALLPLGLLLDGPDTRERSPRRGVACPALHAANRHDRAGDRAAYARAVRAAGAAAEAALERSGEVFGEPERLALELRHRLASSGDLARDVPARQLLARARSACARIGRPEPRL